MRHRSRPEIGLIVLYSVVTLSLLGSLGAGLALTGGEGVVSGAELQHLALAER